MSTAIVWFRRDFRLADNQALAAALTSHACVVPAVVLDPAQLASTFAGEKPLAFFFAGLRVLDAELHRRGSYLVVCRGDPAVELADLAAETGASAVYAQGDASPFALARDTRVASRLDLRLAGGLTVQPPDLLVREDGRPYVVFAQFERAWSRLPAPAPADVLPAPDHIPTPQGLAGAPIPTVPDLPVAVPFLPGEVEAERRLAAFLTGEAAPVYGYAGARDRLDLPATSRLSPYLRFGMLSPRQAVARARQALDTADGETARSGALAWLRQLVWREFYLTLLRHEPAVLGDAQQAVFRGLPWANDEAQFAAWREGRTGYPLVDAAMRQLAVEGWLPNRARLAAASFLVKDLLIDWRWGERHFMEHLVDGDAALNNGNWQWVAGTGTDSMHYFRIFNPVLQSQRYDPYGAYIRAWVAELARVPDEYVHAPWLMPLAEQRRAGCIVGVDYPAPLVDHRAARERALAVYRRALSESRE